MSCLCVSLAAVVKATGIVYLCMVPQIQMCLHVELYYRFSTVACLSTP